MLIHHRAVAYATTTVLALTLAASSAGAYQCKTSIVQAEALGTPKFKSLRSAKAFWAADVKNRYGVAWSVWNIAAAKSHKCDWTGNRFYCIVKAKPCLYVVP